MQHEVEMEIHNREIVIRSLDSPRKGWGKKFEAMTARGDDTLLEPEVQSEWDEEEWEWK
jgi:hypothetical protein